YCALDLKQERKVALKILKKDRTSKQLESHVRFNREIEILSGLRHAGIPEIYGSGEWEGDVYFVSELLMGASLQEIILPGLSPGECLGWAVGVAESLTFIHERGILHRDLKPGNIFLTEDQEGGARKPKLIDFGLAHLLLRERGDGLIGTYGYMAPETIGILRRKVDERSDLYSLGVILYQALSGLHPFEGRSASEIIHKQFTQEPSDLRTVKAGIPPSLAALTRKLLAKDPDERYQGARSLQADLLRIERGDFDFNPGREDRTGKISFATRLAGRGREMERLRLAYAQARLGKGRMILVDGEAGIGKSRLVEELGRNVLSQGDLFLSAKCFDLENKSPLRPVRMILAEFVRLLLQMDAARRS
ncbi:MAG: serine/threonine-protein kinase PknK, partial [Spirochaetia bacterium]|nr:serine/threonine-protein kinase PknK [Spirochaetia bacterium]